MTEEEQQQLLQLPAMCLKKLAAPGSASLTTGRASARTGAAARGAQRGHSHPEGRLEAETFQPEDPRGALKLVKKRAAQRSPETALDQQMLGNPSRCCQVSRQGAGPAHGSGCLEQLLLPCGHRCQELTARRPYSSRAPWAPPSAP